MGFTPYCVRITTRPPHVYQDDNTADKPEADYAKDQRIIKERFGKYRIKSNPRRDHEAKDEEGKKPPRRKVKILHRSEPQIVAR